MSTRNRGADRLARALLLAGVRRLFTLSGNHIMPVFDAALDAGIDLIHTRHEASAVHMADAWGRITGEPGVALVTGGPGHANAISALFTAQMAESPVVLLSGHAALGELGRGAFQEMRQADMTAPTAKLAWTAQEPGGLGHDVARALRIATAGRPGPVHLSLPVDLLEADAGGAAVPDARAHKAAPMPLPEAMAIAMLQRLARAERPLIVVGPLGMTRRGREAVRAVEAATGIPAVASASPRGSNDPALGAFAEVLAQADCLLLVGKRCDFTLRFGGAPTIAPECTFLQIDAEAREIARTRRAVGARLEAAVEADVRAALGCLARVVGRPSERHGAWLARVDAAVGFRPPEWSDARSTLPSRLHPLEACRPWQTILDSHPEAVMVCDGGEFGQWAQATLDAPHRVLNGPSGSIGSALPMAIAARLAVPDAPVIAFTGDGAVGFHIAEIDTALRYSLPFVAVIGNDARWNAEHQIQLAQYGRDRLIGCELLPTRYDLVSVAFGGYGELITHPAELADAAARALAVKLPACINVPIDGLRAPVVRQAAA